MSHLQEPSVTTPLKFSMSRAPVGIHLSGTLDLRKLCRVIAPGGGGELPYKIGGGAHWKCKKKNPKRYQNLN